MLFRLRTPKGVSGMLGFAKYHPQCVGIADYASALKAASVGSGLCVIAHKDLVPERYHPR
jgi:hypothetical protein